MLNRPGRDLCSRPQTELVEHTRDVRFGRAYADGVCILDLAAVVEPEEVLRTMATSLGIHEVPGQRVVETAAEALKGKRSPLVLDNCEHLLDVCADLTVSDPIGTVI